MNRRRVDFALAILILLDLAVALGLALYVVLAPTADSSPEPFVGVVAIGFYLLPAVTAVLGVLAAATLFRGADLCKWGVLAYVSWAIFTSHVPILEPNNPEFTQAMHQLEHEVTRNEVEPSPVPIVSYPFNVSYVIWATALLYVMLVRPRLKSGAA